MEDGQAVQKIAELAIASRSKDNVFFKIPGEPEDVYAAALATTDPDGNVVREWVRTVAEPAPRRYTATTLEEFAEMVNTVGGEDGRVLVFVPDAQPNGRIVAVLDEDKSRRETVVCPFKALTPLVEMHVADMRSSHEFGFSQEDFISFLLHKLRKDKSDALLAAVRNLRFSKTHEASTIVHAAEKGVSRSIAMQCVGGDSPLLDSCSFDTNVFDVLKMHDRFVESLRPTLDLRVDLENECIVVQWPPDALAEWFRWGQSKITEVLRTLFENHEQVIVLRGAPGPQ